MGGGAVTLPWCPMPRALLATPRARMLSLEAVGALMVAWSLSDDGGTIQPAADVTARDALVFVVAQHARESGVLDGETHTHAELAVGELVDGGLLIVDGDALCVDGWVYLDGAPPPRPLIERPAATSVPPAPRTPGRPRSAAPMSAAERQERRRFDRRERGFRNVPQGVTYEQWRAENVVTKTPARGHGNSNAGHGNSNAGHENPRVGHGNSVTKTPAEGRASGSEDQKDTENKGEGESGTRPPGHGNSVTETTLVTETPPTSFRDQPRCPTVESAPFDTDVVLDDMRKASAGRSSSAAVSTQMQAFATLARELIARGHATVPALVKAAGHASHVPWITRLPGPLTVQRLCADEGRVLVELLSGATACAACGGDPLASGVFDVPAPAIGDPVLDDIEAKRAEWQRKYDEKHAARAAVQRGAA